MITIEENRKSSTTGFNFAGAKKCYCWCTRRLIRAMIENL